MGNIRFTNGSNQLILFTNRRKVEGFTLPRLYGKEINLSNTAKVLELILDSKLEWQLHIQARLQKAAAVLRNCRRTYDRNWGLKSKVLMWIYTVVVMQMLSFGGKKHCNCPCGHFSLNSRFLNACHWCNEVYTRHPTPDT